MTFKPAMLSLVFIAYDRIETDKTSEHFASDC
jgi:hypothetical protein